MITKLRLSHLPQVLAILMPLCREKYSFLTLDEEKLRKALVAQFSKGNKSQLMLGSFDQKDNLKGVLIAVGGENVWARKKYLSIVAWVCTSTQEGVALMKTAIRFFREKLIYRVMCFYPDCDMEERIYPILERLGFSQKGRCYIMHRGG